MLGRPISTRRHLPSQCAHLHVRVALSLRYHFRCLLTRCCCRVVHPQAKIQVPDRLPCRWLRRTLVIRIILRTRSRRLRSRLLARRGGRFLSLCYFQHCVELQPRVQLQRQVPLRLRPDLVSDHSRAVKSNCGSNDISIGRANCAHDCSTDDSLGTVPADLLGWGHLRRCGPDVPHHHEQGRVRRGRGRAGDVGD